MQHPAHKIVKEYLLSRKEKIRQQSEYRWINAKGNDMSDLYRGMIQMIDEFLNMENVFETAEKMEKAVEEHEKSLKKN